jgi:hypothetical protein
MEEVSTALSSLSLPRSLSYNHHRYIVNIIIVVSTIIGILMVIVVLVHIMIIIIITVILLIIIRILSAGLEERSPCKSCPRGCDNVRSAG